MTFGNGFAGEQVICAHTGSPLNERSSFTVSGFAAEKQAHKDINISLYRYCHNAWNGISRTRTDRQKQFQERPAYTKKAAPGPLFS
ncbi:hypothetical protein SAMCCGM7_Ch0422 [Sinorhizobium americanum CCGM7]|nr:hypothetical protein SAMCCGM7_Ch0422 [Sinorhizobium americanum CCGM7]